MEETVGGKKRVKMRKLHDIKEEEDGQDEEGGRRNRGEGITMAALAEDDNNDGGGDDDGDSSTESYQAARDNMGFVGDEEDGTRDRSKGGTRQSICDLKVVRL